MINTCLLSYILGHKKLIFLFKETEKKFMFSKYHNLNEKNILFQMTNKEELRKVLKITWAILFSE